ncbi:MAG: lipopolysaccharide biosynthesis protein [Halioglobus sp.]|nr:lipopolysaccharide biosynthesis protein [Halioglobus sp.]
MDIRSKVISALRWSATSRLIGQVLSWAITVYVIRLLSPADYGLMAMAMVVVSFLILLNTLGLDAVLVQDSALDESSRRQVFGVVIVANVVCFIVVCFGAEFVASLYDEPQLVPVLRVLSLQFLLLIFETLPQADLERNMDFAQRSIVDLLTLVLGSVTTLLMALAGLGVWALVWGTLITNAARMVGLNLICRSLLWPRFSLRGMARHLSFGGFVSVDRGLWYLFSESDKFVGGKLLGNQLLGYYAVASQLASLPINKISGLLNAVALPAFSRAHAQAGTAAVRAYLLKSTHLLSIAAFPVFFGISCIAEPLIAVFLGQKWLPAAPVLQVLGLVMPFRLLSNVFPPLLWGMGHPRTSAGNYLIAGFSMPLAFVAGAHWGVVGLACAWLVTYPFVFAWVVHRTCRQVAVPLVDYLAQMVRPLGAALAMYAVVSVLGGVALGDDAAWATLVQLVLSGIAMYGAVMLLIDRPGLAAMRALIRQ